MYDNSVFQFFSAGFLKGLRATYICPSILISSLWGGAKNGQVSMDPLRMSDTDNNIQSLLRIRMID